MNIDHFNNSKKHFVQPRRSSLVRVSKLIMQTVGNNPWISTYDHDFAPVALRRSSSRLEPNAVNNHHAIARNDSMAKADNQVQKITKARQSLPNILSRPQIHLPADSRPDPYMPASDSDSEPMNPCYNTDGAQKRLENIYDGNKGYFAHLSGACLCTMCQCGKCKCDYPRQMKIPMRGPSKASLYQDTFTGAEPIEGHKIYKAPLEMCPRIDEKIAQSIYQADFKPTDPSDSIFTKNFQLVRRDGDNADGTKHLKAPFPKQSVSKENYPDWQRTSKPVIIACPMIPTTDKRFPFFDKLSSKDYGNFNRTDIQPNFDPKQFGKQQFKNPINPETGLVGLTHNAMTYQKPKRLSTGANTRRFSFTKPALAPINQNYKSQYKTTYQNHIQGPQEPCPSRKIILEDRQRDFLCSLRPHEA